MAWILLLWGQGAAGPDSNPRFPGLRNLNSTGEKLPLALYLGTAFCMLRTAKRETGAASLNRPGFANCADRSANCANYRNKGGRVAQLVEQLAFNQ